MMGFFILPSSAILGFWLFVFKRYLKKAEGIFSMKFLAFIISSWSYKRIYILLYVAAN